MYLNHMLPKPAIRRSLDAMMQDFLAKGGKVRRVPCEGKTPKLPGHFCDPRNRHLFFSTSKAVRAAPARASYGVSRLLAK